MEWRTIETAPKDETPIDIWIEEVMTDDTVQGRRITNVIWNGRNWEPQDFGLEIEESEYTKVTHWMPLPTPPQLGK